METTALNLKQSFKQGKIKVVPVLLTEHHAMKVYWGSGDIAPHILDLRVFKSKPLMER
jgi:hypothetical protein